MVQEGHSDANLVSFLVSFILTFHASGDRTIVLSGRTIAFETDTFVLHELQGLS